MTVPVKVMTKAERVVENIGRRKDRVNCGLCGRRLRDVRMHMLVNHP